MKTIRPATRFVLCLCFMWSINCSLESGTIDLDQGEDRGLVDGGGDSDGSPADVMTNPDSTDATVDEGPTCSNQCPQKSDKQCNGDGVEVCDYHNGQLCLAWGGKVNCEQGQTCDTATKACKYTYPSGTNGTHKGDLIENICLEECICTGGSPSAQQVCLDSFLDKKAALVTAHTGWCGTCQEQESSMENFFQTYKGKGLDIMLVLMEDENLDYSRNTLLQYCCSTKQSKNFTFHVVIDPGGKDNNVMSKYFDAGELPLNLVMNQQMIIKYKAEGDYSGVQNAVSQLCN